jgi:hypothetical protein
MSPLFRPTERTGVGIKQEGPSRHVQGSPRRAIRAFDAVGIFSARLKAFQEGMPDVSSAVLRCQEREFEHRRTVPGQEYY